MRQDSTCTSTTNTSKNAYVQEGFFSYENTPPERAWLTLFYSNVTTWGTQAAGKTNRCEDFVAKEDSSVICFAEHHLDRRQFAPVRSRLRNLRRASYVSFAKRLGLHESSTSGGQLILPLASLETSELDSDLLDHCLPREHAQAPRWTPMALRTKSVSILIITVYLKTAEGLSEGNRAILDQLLLVTQFFQGLVVILGDWQMTPQELSQFTLLERAGLAIVAPADVDATCNTGKRRIIDFCLVSIKLVPHLHLESELKVPWKPHIGLRLSFPARPRSLSAPALRVPRPLPQIPLEEGKHVLDQSSWSNAGAVAELFIHKRSAATGLLGCNKELAAMIPEPQFKLSKDLCKAATHLEVYHLLQAKIPLSERSKYIGRGALPHASVRPLVDRQFLMSRYSCSICDLWDMVLTLLGWILRFASSGAQGQNASKAIVDLKSLEPRVPSSWLRAAAPNAPAEAWCRFIRSMTMDQVKQAALGFTPDRISIWIDRADAQKSAALKQNKCRIRNRFRAWLRQDLNSGGSGAHKLVSEKTFQEQPSAATVQTSFDFWTKLWAADDVFDASNAVVGTLTKWMPWTHQLKMFLGATSNQGMQQSKLEQLRESTLLSLQDVMSDAAQANRQAFTVEDLLSAAKSYPDKKAMGIDFWRTAVFRVLPPEALQSLANVVDSSFKILQWPVQMLLNLMALIPKTAGGERPIAKTPLLYRLSNVWSMPVLREWGEANVAEFDYATRGRSALTSASLRAWSNEVASIAGQESLSVLWDLDKFYDSIDPQDVMCTAVDAAYPPSQLVMALSMHMAPRCLLLNGIASQIIFPNKSIIAGCSHSNFFARLPLQKPIRRMAAEAPQPKLKIATFVDDVAQISRGRMSCIAEAAIKAAMTFCVSMKALGLRVSAKTVIVSSNHRLATALAVQIRKRQGVKVTVAQAGRDLGVTNAPTRRRCTSIQNSRLTKAKAKLGKIARYTKAVRAARRLVTAGAMPQALWGCGAIGLAPTVIKDLRTSMATASGITAAGRCPITAVAIAYGQYADPEISSAVEQIRLWLELWKSDAGLRALSVRYWKDMLNRVGKLQCDQATMQSSWNSVNGPFGATLCMLLDQDWKVDNPAIWYDPSGKGWHPDTSADPKPFVQLIRDFACQKLWNRAEDHWHGMGLRGGVDWKASMTLHNHITKVGGGICDDTEEVIQPEIIDQIEDQEIWPHHALTWLEIFMAGAYWPADRASKIHNIRPVCGRCGAPVETALHLIWTCPGNAQIQDERVVSTQSLISEAVAGTERYPCFWLRGLMPKQLLSVNTPVVTDDTLEVIGNGHAAGCWPAGEYFTDASGGPNSQIEQLRRCGVGVAMLHGNVTPDLILQAADLFSLLTFGVFAPLPGHAQTSPRGELYAILLVVRNVSEGNLCIKSDSKISVDLFRAGKERCLEAANSDLWAEIWQLLDDKPLRLTLQWVKGHGDVPETYDRYALNPLDVVGNVLADQLADYAADLYKVWEHDTFNINWHLSLIQRVQARAVCILDKVLESRTHVRAAVQQTRERPLSRSAAAFRSQHRFTTISGRTLHCRACLQTSPATAEGVRSWLASPCTPNLQLERATRFASTRPTSVPAGVSVKVGRVHLHESHRLAVYRGLYYCTFCGYSASVKAQQLTRECTRMSSQEAVDRVLALSQGRLPSGRKRWPNDSEECLP